MGGAAKYNRPYPNWATKSWAVKRAFRFPVPDLSKGRRPHKRFRASQATQRRSDLVSYLPPRAGWIHQEACNLKAEALFPISTGSESLHSIILSARRARPGGTSRPMALAVFRLTTSSNRVGCSIGMSAGLVPTPRFLRARRQRPGSDDTGENRDEFPPG